MGKLTRTFTIAALVVSAACTTSQTPEPGLAGPSELALSLRVTATPDSLAQDGASRSAVVVKAFDSTGRPCFPLPVHLEMAVNGQFQDYGTLSSRDLVTGSDGSATAVYTAPPAPSPLAGGSSTLVAIVATPSSSAKCGSVEAVGNFDSTNRQFTEIRLVPPGVILPPAQKPTPRFTFTTPVSTNANTMFDGSSSCPNGVDSGGSCLPPSGAGASVVGYSWTFGDGGTATGVTAIHTFRTVGKFTVTLTVTNDRGASASSAQQVTVDPLLPPTASIDVLPSDVFTTTLAAFDGSGSKAAAGHQIVSYVWDFGDGAGSSGIVVRHTYAAAGNYVAVLTVTDDVGQVGIAAKEVVVK